MRECTIDQQRGPPPAWPYTNASPTLAAAVASTEHREASYSLFLLMLCLALRSIIEDTNKDDGGVGVRVVKYDAKIVSHMASY